MVGCRTDASAPVEKPQFPAKDAIEVARKLVRFLKPQTQKLIVAESLRRRKGAVRDIEILFIPKFTTEVNPGAFFAGPHQVNLTERAIDVLLELGILEKRPKIDGSLTWGADNKLGLHTESGIAVDLFTATPTNWFNYLVCRTGGTKNNIAICNAARARGWKWNPYGDGFSRTNPDERRVVISEREVFDFVGLPYLEPWER